MKREMVMWLIIAVLVVGALLLGTQKAEPMAIRFDGNGDRVSFPATASLDNISLLSVCLVTNANALPDTSAANDFWIGKLSNGVAGWLVSGGDQLGGTNMLVFTEVRAVAGGYWTTPNNSLITGTPQTICVTYDRTSDANAPIVYIDGVAQVLTERTVPSGATVDDSGSVVELGGSVLGASWTFDGIIHDARIYNRILTADEVLQIYNARGRDNIKNGLVFCPFLKGAAGLHAFDGATLAAGNTIVDPCSGAVGVPAGNPVGVGETYLR